MLTVTGGSERAKQCLRCTWIKFTLSRKVLPPRSGSLGWPEGHCWEISAVGSCKWEMKGRAELGWLGEGRQESCGKPCQ